MNIMNTPKTEIEAGKDLPLYVHELDGQRFGISHQDEAGHTHLIAIVPPYLGNGEKAIAICKAVNCHDELVKSLGDLLRKTSSIEVLGEWEALDINTGVRKTTRASVDAVINAATAILKKAGQI